MKTITKGIFKQFPDKFPNKKILSLDIGGTLAKTAFYIPKDDPKLKDSQYQAILNQDSIPIELQNGDRIYLKSFPSAKIKEFLTFAKTNNIVDENTLRIHATGGGAYKYSDLIESEFRSMGVNLIKHDEMESMVNGMAFILSFAKQSSFTYSFAEDQKFLDKNNSQFPKLLVSIGSGVSIIKINDFNSYERVSGTMIGGGTLLGLSNLLTGINDFDSICEHASRGNNAEVDMLIKDIYGLESPYKDLQGDLLASSFARVAFDNQLDGSLMFNRLNTGKYKKEDVLSSLVFMIAFNIGQIAYLTSRIHKVDQMYFIGNFVKNHKLIMDKLNFALEYMSERKLRARFITYDGYQGAIGAFLKEFDMIDDKV